MADEADSGNVLAVKNIRSRAADLPRILIVLRDDLEVLKFK